LQTLNLLLILSFIGYDSARRNETKVDNHAHTTLAPPHYPGIVFAGDRILLRKGGERGIAGQESLPFISAAETAAGQIP
jgi:hypothetical protein